MNKYREVIAGLRELATRLEKDSVLGLDTPGRPWVSLNILPGIRGDDASTIGAVDTASRALFDRPATTERMTGGTWHHNADGRIGPIEVSVFGGVSDPAERDLRAEVERLRAQLAERDTPPVVIVPDEAQELFGDANRDKRGSCGATSFTSSHRWVPDTQVPDHDGYLDWEVCGRSADDPIHHTDEVSEVAR